MKTHPIVEQSRRALELIEYSTKVPPSSVLSWSSEHKVAAARFTWFWLLVNHYKRSQYSIAQDLAAPRESVRYGVRRVNEDPELLAVARDVILVELVREDGGRAAA